MKSFISYILLFLGIVLLFLCSLLVIQRYNPKRLSFNEPIMTSGKVSNSNLPMAISFPSFHQTLAVFPAKINGSTWETTTQGVSYLASSPVPGARGNSIMYGHNWSNLLGGLSQLKPGDKFSIVYQNGDKKIFKVQFASIVNPDQNQILAASKDTRLTIYTCTGFLDSKRLVITAFLDDSKPVAQGSLQPLPGSFVF